MASSSPTETTPTEQAGSQDYTNRHFEKIFAEGFSFSGYERDRVWLGGPDGKFADVSGVSCADSPTDGRGAVFADLDNDGDTDIFLHTIQGPRHLLFRNNVGQDGRWIRIVLEGTRSNRDAAGAIVKVSTGGRVEAKVLAAGSGYLTGHDPRLLFGLGAARQADLVEVRWPSGLVERFENIPAGRTVRLREGAGRPETLRVARFRLPDPVEVPEAPTLIAAGDAFPQMVLATPGGERRSLASFRRAGQHLLVNFWATWCVPCRKEMPRLEAISREYAGRLAVVGVSLDLEDPGAVPGYLKSQGITYPILMAGETTPLQVFREDNVLLPSSFLVDEAGIVRGVFTGGDEAVLRDLDRALRAALGPPATPSASAVRGSPRPPDAAGKGGAAAGGS